MLSGWPYLKWATVYLSSYTAGLSVFLASVFMTIGGGRGWWGVASLSLATKVSSCRSRAHIVWRKAPAARSITNENLLSIRVERFRRIVNCNFFLSILRLRFKLESFNATWQIRFEWSKAWHIFFSLQFCRHYSCMETAWQPSELCLPTSLPMCPSCR